MQYPEASATERGQQIFECEISAPRVEKCGVPTLPVRGSWTLHKFEKKRKSTSPEQFAIPRLELTTTSLWQWRSGKELKENLGKELALTHILYKISSFTKN